MTNDFISTVHTLTTYTFFSREQDPKEWDAMWAALGVPDFREEDPETGEAWQYMGTVEPTPSAYVHQFRHRACPSQGGARTGRAIPATPRWAPPKKA